MVSWNRGDLSENDLFVVKGNELENRLFVANDNDFENCLFDGSKGAPLRFFGATVNRYGQSFD